MFRQCVQYWQAPHGQQFGCYLFRQIVFVYFCHCLWQTTFQQLMQELGSVLTKVPNLFLAVLFYDLFFFIAKVFAAYRWIKRKCKRQHIQSNWKLSNNIITVIITTYIFYKNNISVYKNINWNDMCNFCLGK